MNIDKTSLTDSQYQVLVGSLLGKGTISKVKAYNYHSYKEVSGADSSCLEWKSTFLESIGAKLVDGRVLTFHGHRILENLRRCFYFQSGHKTNLDMSEIHRLDHLAFFILFLDCGVLLGTYAGIKIKGFSRESTDKLVSFINNKFNLSLYLSREYKAFNSQTSSRRIMINNSNLKLLIPEWQLLTKKFKLPESCCAKIAQLQAIVETNSTLNIGKRKLQQLRVKNKRRCCSCGVYKPLNLNNFHRVERLVFSYACKKCTVSKPDTASNSKQQRSMLLHLKDKNGDEIAEILGITRERVRQLRWRLEMKRPIVDRVEELETRELASAQKRIFKAKVNNCKYRKIEFSVKFEEIVWPTYCPVLGIKLDYFAEKASRNSPSFDRITPSLGYTSGNVAIISKRANLLKNDGTAEEHQKIVEYIKKAIDTHAHGTVVGYERMT